MVKRRLMLTFTQEQVREPVVYNLGQQFNLVTNIVRASLSEDAGWILLEVQGTEEGIEQGIAWMISRGVRVEPANEDIMED